MEISTILSFLDDETTVASGIGEGNAACAGLAGVLYYAVYVVKVIQIVAPIALIIWGSIDLLKSIISGDEKKISAARKPFIQRLLSAVLIFVLPWIVNLVINFTTGSTNESSEWRLCWRTAWNGGEKTDISVDNTDLWDSPEPEK